MTLFTIEKSVCKAAVSVIKRELPFFNREIFNLVKYRIKQRKGNGEKFVIMVVFREIIE